jgi:hypothetical protein
MNFCSIRRATFPAFIVLREIHGSPASPGGEPQHCIFPHIIQCASLSRYKHPFTAALDKLPSTYAPWLFQVPQPQVPKPLKEQACTYVETTGALQELTEHLSTVREFAVDLEHSDR